MKSAASYLADMAPAPDFRLTVDTTRMCKAYGYFLSADDTGTTHNEVTDTDVDLPANIIWHPLPTKTSVTPPTGYSVVYLYDDDTN